MVQTGLNKEIKLGTFQQQQKNFITGFHVSV